MVLRIGGITLQILFVVLSSVWRALADRTTFKAALLLLLPEAIGSIGGAFPKIGQILSTRRDVFSSEVCDALAHLQDDFSPLTPRTVTAVLSAAGLTDMLTGPGETVASATIAHVQRDCLKKEKRQVAIKILRPKLSHVLATDCKIAMRLAHSASLLPRIAGVPVVKAFEEVTALLIRQTDFILEAQNHERLQSAFATDPAILVPPIVTSHCTPTVLVTEYIEGLRKVTDRVVPDDIARSALKSAVRALYTMIFRTGLVHCDMHPGNILIDPQDRLVILDAGCMSEVSAKTRKAFAEFFIAVALNDATTVAEVVLETAERIPESVDMNVFNEDVTRLIGRFGGLRAKEFQVAEFVAELFAVQRKQGIVGTAEFTTTILALLVLEGTVKSRYPDFDFQTEAIPFALMAAVA